MKRNYSLPNLRSIRLRSMRLRMVQLHSVPLRLVQRRLVQLLRPIFVIKPGLIVVFVLLAGVSMQSYSQELSHLYKAGEDGYTCFRIPAIITTSKGTVLAFAEARRNNCGDAGDIDIVVKRSADNGKTWSNLSLVWSDSTNTCGNPAPVVDQKSGKIILLSTWNLGTDHEKDIIAKTAKDTRRVFVLNSADDGQHWSAAKEITTDVKKDNWTWYATGPVNGIQIRKGKHKGRLVIACDHIEADTKKYFSHAIYSDNGGDNWKLGGTTPADGVNECTVAELPKGVLMLNMRNFGTSRNRQVALSKDGGESWSELKSDTTLVEPVCQGSLLSYNYKRKKSFLVFSNPANQKARTNMTVRISYDNGSTWKSKNVLHEGPAAYSNLVVLPNGNLACLYEAGNAKPYEGIVFEELSLGDFK
ncbi:sialidase family protein [Flavitalea sp.]|nr:sialidase family protein [Flavitalea sp.]